MTKRVPIQIAAVVLVAATAAHADIDRSKYHPLPGLQHRLIDSMAIRANDKALSPEVHRRYAGQHPSGDYDVYFNREGTVDAVDVIRSLEGCDEFIRRLLLTARVTPNPGQLFVEYKTVELRFEAPPPSSEATAHVEIDRSRYHEIPDAGTPTFQVMNVPWAYQRNYADQVNCNTNPPPTGDYDVYVDRNGIATNVDVIRSIPGCDEYVARNLRAGRQIKQAFRFVHPSLHNCAPFRGRAAGPQSQERAFSQIRHRGD